MRTCHHTPLHFHNEYGLILTKKRKFNTKQPQNHHPITLTQQKTLSSLKTTSKSKINPNATKIFLNDYQLVEDRKKPQMRWSGLSRKRTAPKHQNKIVRYRHASSNPRNTFLSKSNHTEAKMQNTVHPQTSKISNFFRSSRSQLSIANQCKSMTHTLSTRSMSKTTFRKQNQ